jgi:hypothetical protein
LGDYFEHTLFHQRVSDETDDTMIIKVPIASLDGLPEAYAADLRAIATAEHGGNLLCDDLKLREVVAKHRPEKLQGLGDLIHRLTKTLRIPECPGCQKRRPALNKSVPFPVKV